MSLLPLSIPSPPPEWQIPLIDSSSARSRISHPHVRAVHPRRHHRSPRSGSTSRLDQARGAEPRIVLDIIIWAVPLGIVGARIYHVATHPGDYFCDGADPGICYAARRHRVTHLGGRHRDLRRAHRRRGRCLDRLQLDRHPLLDLRRRPRARPCCSRRRSAASATGSTTSSSACRPTCRGARDRRATTRRSPSGLADGTLFHPTFLYEMIWNVVGIVFLLAMERQFRLEKRKIFGVTLPVPVGNPIARLQWGKVWALYMIWYGVGRAWFESIRLDPSEIILGLRINVWGAFAAIVLGIVLFLVQRRRHPGVEPSAYMPGREWTPEGAVDSGETYSDDRRARRRRRSTLPKSTPQAEHAARPHNPGSLSFLGRLTSPSTAARTCTRTT